MWRFNRKKIIQIAILGWILMIFVLCTLPNETLSKINTPLPFLDKIIHFGLFFLLSIFISSSTIWGPSITFAKRCAISIFIAFVYGGLIEILQPYFFNRGGEIEDLIADLLGGISGCFSYPLFKYIKNKN